MGTTTIANIIIFDEAVRGINTNFRVTSPYVATHILIVLILFVIIVLIIAAIIIIIIIFIISISISIISKTGRTPKTNKSSRGTGKKTKGNGGQRTRNE
jgi:hypothetical protein